MSHPRGRDGSTSYTPNVSSSSPTSLRHPSIASASGQSVFSQTLIPRDYLSSLSKPRANGFPSPPSSSIPSLPQTASDTTQRVAVKASVIRQELSPDLSDEEEEETDEDKSKQAPEPTNGNTLNVNKTRESESLSQLARPNQVSGTLPDSPRSVTSTILGDPRLQNNMPRTSSIDSAISTISNSSFNQKSASEQREASITDIRNLIATAGSAENLVQHLLRDKSHAASQNAQLWKLVDKQRALLLGLNKDLERLTRERDRYRKKAKELHALHSTSQINGHAAKLDSPVIENMQYDGSAGAVKSPSNRSDKSPTEDSMKPSPLHPQHQPVSMLPDMETRKASIDITPPSENTSEYFQENTKTVQPPKLSSLTTQLAPPVFNLTEATPIGEASGKSFGGSRKTVPKPLNLRSSREDAELAQMAMNESVVEDSDMEIPDSRERGRRKTREEDDRDRERALAQEEEHRSRSKKSKSGKSPSVPAESNSLQPEQSQVPQQPMTQLESGRPALLAAPVPASLVPQQTDSGKVVNHLSPPLRSPGLPASPRPMDRPLVSPLPAHMNDRPIANSLPMSPRNGGFQLSPRAPKQPIPMPNNSHIAGVNSEAMSISQTLANDASSRPQPEQANNSTDVPSVYRGLVSPNLPDLLLPPNALPSIQVKVASSRLRPSRFSVLGFKPQEDSSVFTLSIFSRSNSSELWRLEKIPASLPHLEQQLRPRCQNLPRLPDRKLFSGHSPALIDARRAAIEAYFDELLDTEVDEQSAILICRYLSTDVLDPQSGAAARAAQHQPVVLDQNSGSKLSKSGFLTKKGKNFGGWKSRYFVLDSPELRYFEAPGGAHLGTIKLQNARIGRQTAHDGSHEEGDEYGQFRHAFLILEPKRKDSGAFVRHVLCAENDQERDEWVQVLLHYVEESPPEGHRPTTSSGDVSYGASSNNQRKYLNGADAEISGKPNSPIVAAHSNSGSASPTSASSQQAEGGGSDAAYARAQQMQGNASRTAPKQSISLGTGQSQPKIRSLFQFKKASQEQLNANSSSNDRAAAAQNQAQKDRGYVRPVFGLPLAEAVEMCPPDDVNVLLPAVVYRCIEYLRGKKASNEEGLFRLSGSNLVIRTLKERFNSEGDIDLLAEGEYYDVHAIASLFKTYLRELPSTILTRDLHIEFLKVLELSEKSEKVTAFNVLVHRLPAVNFALLYTMSEYLLEVVRNSERNKMTIKNVGIVFAPTLNIPAPVFSMFLTDFEAIFVHRAGDEQIVERTLEIRHKQSESDDVRSPRHQMFSDISTPAYNEQSFSHNAMMSGNQASMQGRSHEHQTSADLGMTPLQQSYESRSYVSIPGSHAPPQPLYPPPNPNQQLQPRGQYRMVEPQDARDAKAKRRESSMLLF